MKNDRNLKKMAIRTTTPKGAVEPGVVAYADTTEEAEEYVFNELMKFIRKGEESSDPNVVELAKDLAEFTQRVHDGKRRVRQIAQAMR
jgi:hypothetical protein